MREQEITTLERAQLGLVTAGQLGEIGLSRSTVYRRRKQTRHSALRRGVLLSGSVVPAFEQRVLAAVLACGGDACGSHESAAQLMSLLVPGGAMIEITTSLERHPVLDGVRVHRSSTLAPEDVTELDRIRLTAPARTIVDLSSRLDMRSLGRMVDDALRRKIVTLASLHETVERLRPAPGRSIRKMRVVLARRDDGTARRESKLEDFIQYALTRFDLPQPEVQYRVVVADRERRIDFCYPESMVALEPKGFDFRRFRQRFDDDALRGNELQLAGYKVLDFTSAFTDWKIACQVAEALGLPLPRRPRRVLTFLEWLNRLESL